MMVYDWMLHLPIWLQALVVIGVAGVVSLAVTGTLRTITALHYGESHNEVIGFVFATCGVIYAVLLAFVVFAVYTQFASADKVVTSEATTLLRYTSTLSDTRNPCAQRSRKPFGGTPDRW